MNELIEMLNMTIGNFIAMIIEPIHNLLYVFFGKIYELIWYWGKLPCLLIIAYASLIYIKNQKKNERKR